ncbi:hypothetical protein AB205_0209860 [Aquarana catesbeiana]|uniref:Uncharacterized protein n=1 Tax=Aquarana catesbeiana TaxID=8400 RepID=A0A2G9PLU3_AQUCT|nr:hypothetical protein AB205_0209860 [Aquarana catesbeiana]
MTCQTGHPLNTTAKSAAPSATLTGSFFSSTKSSARPMSPPLPTPLMPFTAPSVLTSLPRFLWLTASLSSSVPTSWSL